MPRSPVQVTWEGKTVPTLMVRFRCEYRRKDVICPGGATENAYLGPIQCHGEADKPHPPTFMTPIEIVL